MYIKLDDGREFYLPGEQVPPDMTAEQIQSMYVPWHIHAARLRVAEAQAELDAAPPMPKEDELLAWATNNHPTSAARLVLLHALADSQAALADIEGR